MAVMAMPLAAACGGGGNDGEPTEVVEGSPHPEADPDPVADAGLSAGESVAVTLIEWKVKPASAEFKSGTVRFEARNAGSETHELVICANSCKAGEDAAFAEVDGLKPGDQGAFVITLDAGEYELACLINDGDSSHYARGMHARITVR
jgi:uncharacterized cupredoxin-like copper-binding protein